MFTALVWIFGFYLIYEYFVIQMQLQKLRNRLWRQIYKQKAKRVGFALLATLLYATWLTWGNR